MNETMEEELELAAKNRFDDPDYWRYKAEQDYCEHCNTTLTSDELAYAAKIDTYYCTNCAYILLK
jgi:formamidopyrimidine-DNA glycosylase